MSSQDIEIKFMHKKIYKLWKKSSSDRFWGNFFDSRFYISYLISKTSADMILDVGCGTGILLHQAHSPLKIGLDLDIKGLKIAKKLDPKMELIAGDAANLPFRGNLFPLILAVQLLVQLKKGGADWVAGLNELKRISNNKCKLIIAGNNRTSRHFDNLPKEENVSYLNYNEQLELLKDEFEVKLEGYDPHSKLIMFPLKKILFKIPDGIEEALGIHKILFAFLKSKRYLKNGRSYLMICKKR